MGTGINEIDWNEVRADFIKGWKCWVAFGYVDTARCVREGAKGSETKVSFEYRDGYAAAAHDNECGGGERPCFADAKEAAEDYVAEKQAEAADAYAAYAD